VRPERLKADAGGAVPLDMANQAEVIEVKILGGKVKKHRGSGFFADDRGNLVISFEKQTACIYPQGQWLCAHRTGNGVKDDG
jgi:hypothetical protein